MSEAQDGAGRVEAVSRVPPYLLLGVLTLLAWVVLGSALIGHLGFPLDDSWIHQTIARNLAEYGSLGYLPRQRSSGSTSLLWTLLLAPKYLLFPHLSPLAYALSINGAALVGIVAVLWRLALKDRMPVALALLWAVTPLTGGNFVWLAFTGMEHLLFVLLSLWSILLWDSAQVDAGWAGLSLGLLAMTRPEGCVLLLLLPAWRAFGRRRKDALRAALVALPLAVIPFAINLYTAHALLPLTLKGREWLFLGGEARPLHAASRLFLSWFHRLFYAWLAPPAGDVGIAHRSLDSLASLAALLLAAAGLLSLWRDRCRLSLMVCGWGLVHSALYLVILPTTGHGGRYQPFLLMLQVPLGARGVYLLAQRLRLPGQARLALPWACALLFAFASLRLWRATLRSGVQHIEGSHGVMAQYLNSRLPGQTLAIFDIGRIGYSYHGSVVDLGGLTDPAYTPYLLGGQVPAYLQQHGIRFVVLPMDPDGSSRIGAALRLTGNPDVVLRPLFRACSPTATWSLGFLETSDALPCQELDALSFR